MKSKIICLSKVCETSTKEFQAHTMRESKVIRSKKSKFIIRSNFPCNSFFSSTFYWNYNGYWYAYAS